MKRLHKSARLHLDKDRYPYSFHYLQVDLIYGINDIQDTLTNTARREACFMNQQLRDPQRDRDLGLRCVEWNAVDGPLRRHGEFCYASAGVTPSATATPSRARS